jgi:hypothetical protein
MCIIAFNNPKFHNSEPEFKKRSGQLRDSGWYTVDGYLKESNELSRCILLNRKYLRAVGKDYRHFGTLRFDYDFQDSEEVKALFETMNKRLRGKVDVLFIKEVNPENDRIHCHFLSTTEGDIQHHIEAALPDYIPRNPGYLKILPFEGRLAFWCAFYITKGKVAKYFNGHLISRDRYAQKRHLFKSDVGFHKVSKVGKFWAKSRNALWQEIKNTEQRITVGMGVDGADELVDYLDELTQGYFGSAELRRRVGFHALDYEAEGTIQPPKSVYEYDPPPKPPGSPIDATSTPPKAKGNRGSIAAPNGSVGHPEGLSAIPRHAFFGVYPQYHPP